MTPHSDLEALSNDEWAKPRNERECDTYIHPERLREGMQI
jgi:hypothetical protein